MIHWDTLYIGNNTYGPVITHQVWLIATTEAIYVKDAHSTGKDYMQCGKTRQGNQPPEKDS